MAKSYRYGVFIFRRDLRLDDNIGLLEALSECDTVLPVFIFDPRQVTDTNEYLTYPGLQCMLESLFDLDKQLQDKGSSLYCFSGEPDEVIRRLIEKISVDAIFFNTDYTPFSKKRDEALQRVCTTNKISLYTYHDTLLCGNPDLIMTGSQTPYKVFTPFYKACLQHPIKEPTQNRFQNFETKRVVGSKSIDTFKDLIAGHEKDTDFPGGSAAAKKIIDTLEKYSNYTKTRDLPAKDGVTNLSRYNKFGCMSPRRIAKYMVEKLGTKAQPLIRQLYWRDFYLYIAHHFPYVFGSTFQKQFSNISWSKSTKNFQAWCEGKTGFPIVDAGMRELNETGYMHNRLRLITASFLVKDLHISWEWGEKYFAHTLADYDPAVNNGNWQWVAGTGADAAPYFRIFNPWTQQKKFDPECEYIKKWVPELRNVAIKDIHGYEHNEVTVADYPRPMVDHSIERDITKNMYNQSKE